MRLRRLLVALALLLAAAGAHAQTDTTAVRSDRQLRQQYGWDIARLQSAIADLQVALARLIEGRDAIHARIVRDSLRAVAPLPPDTTTLPPPVDTDVPPPPADTTVADSSTYLTGTWDAPGLPLDITHAGVTLTGTTGTGEAFTGTVAGQSITLSFPNGVSFAGTIQDADHITGTLTGSSWSTAWPIARRGAAPAPGNPQPPPGPLPPPTTPGANEPSGMTPFFYTDGSVRDFGPKWIKAAKWLDDRYTRVIDDATNPTGSGKAIEKRWYAGEPRDNGGGLTTIRNFSDLGGFPARVLYVRLVVKFSSNYDRDPNYGGTKLGYWGSDGGPLTYFTWIMGDGQRAHASLGGENPTIYHFGPSNIMRPGEWHTFEFVQTAQSSRGANDGRWEWWIDGQKVIDAQGQRFASTHGPLFNGYQLFFIRGFVNGTFKVDDWLRVGEFYISGKR